MTARRLVSWLVLGAGAAVAELGLLKLLVDVLLWPLPLATAVAAEVLILIKFVIADRWVFGHSRPTWQRLVRYHGACAGALVVYWLVINGLAQVGIDYEVGFVLGSGAAFVWSLLTNFLWVWARPPARSTHTENASGIAEHHDAPRAISYHE